MNLKLGTRRSLLAMAQSLAVARDIESLGEGISVEQVGIDTQGDLILDLPLQKVEGKDFFVKEIDQALIDERVELTVHSLKDLSIERPDSIAPAVIPKREDSRDVVVFGPATVERLLSGQTLKIGTSSPRRLQNVPPLLKRLLPWVGGQSTRLEFAEIRGNVNTRLGRVREPVDSEKYLDGVVLALAGLNRLFADEKARIELSRLLDGCRFVVLPLLENPTAPGQGALAVEARADDTETQSLLFRLHCDSTASAVRGEREILSQMGGGCHQRFGVSEFFHDHLGRIRVVKGLDPDGNRLDEFYWNAPDVVQGDIRHWSSSNLKRTHQNLQLPEVSELDGRSLFIAKACALPDEWTQRFKVDKTTSKIWTAGLKSWEKLARQGIWVEGCAEGLGWNWIRSTVEKPCLALAPADQWVCLTHSGGVSGWESAIATYSVEVELTASERSELAAATDVYWTSYSLFEKLGSLASDEVRHSCGPGKTADEFKARGIDVEVFPSQKEWREWLGIKLD